MTAYKVTEAVKEWIDRRYGNKDVFDRLGGGILTGAEARKSMWDLFTVDDNVALVMIVEGIYEWSDWAAADLRFTGFHLQPLTGYALAIYCDN